ncbi:MAG: sodium:solute symporter family protein [Planctomycetota bacterium]|jgi:SSS family solute:Na+ symporter
MNLHLFDILAIVTYMVGTALIGVYFSRKNRSTEEYFVGGRSFPGWVIGLSLVGTGISSVTFLAYPADAFKTSWIRFLPNVLMPLAVLIAAYFFLPFFRRGRITSAYEYLEDRFGVSVRLYGSASYILRGLIRISIMLYLVSILFSQVTGLSLAICIIVAGIFVTFYTVLGGIDAVIWTDVIQTIVLVSGALLCLGVVVSHLPGGIEQVFEVAIEHGKLSFSEWVNGELIPIPWKVSLSEKTGSMMMLFGLTIWLTMYSSEQETVQRYCASKSVKEARKGMFWVVAASLPIWAFFMFLGTSLFVFFHDSPTPESTAMLSGDIKAERILPYFIINFLPPGISGLVIAAALAAAMSSLDSIINAISTVLTVDFFKPHLIKGKTDADYLRIARLLALLAGGIMIGGALLLSITETKTLEHTALVLASIIISGRLGLYLFGFFTTIGDSKAVWTGLSFSFLFTLWSVLSEKDILPESLTFPFDLYYTGIVGNIIMFLVGFFVAVLIPAKKRDLTNLSIWTQDGTPLH